MARKKLSTGMKVLIGVASLLVLVLVASGVFMYRNLYASLWSGDIDAVDMQGLFPDTSPGHHVYTLGEVIFHVEIPQAESGTRPGLIVDMHGASMNAQQEDDGTHMRELGREYGYVVLQPEAPTLVVSTTMDEPTFAMIELLTKELDLDRDRIHMTGFSMGGLMTWRFVCDHSDVLASAAPAAAAPGNNPLDPPGCNFTDDDKPSTQIPILQLQGIQDPVISYDSALTLRDGIRVAWGLDAGTLVSEDPTYRRDRYTNPQGTVYEFIQHDYASRATLLGMPIAGHCIPGGTAVHTPGQGTERTPFGCEGSASFDWGTEVMAFFVAHPRK